MTVIISQISPIKEPLVANCAVVDALAAYPLLVAHGGLINVETILGDNLNFHLDFQSELASDFLQKCNCFVVICLYLNLYLTRMWKELTVNSSIKSNSPKICVLSAAITDWLLTAPRLMC